MASTTGETHRRPITLAPAPIEAFSAISGANGGSPHPTMPNACQSCTKRKVKCDKLMLICSGCRKRNVNCIYQELPIRQRKRKLCNDADERLIRYERILSQHGLLPDDFNISSSTGQTPEGNLAIPRDRSHGPDTSRPGKLLASQGKSRYLDSDVWRDLDYDETQPLSDDEMEDQALNGFTESGIAGFLPSDPLTGAFMGSEQSLRKYHPTHAEAMKLWNMHIRNVEPICKILHIPLTSKMVEVATQQHESISRINECLLFAIYHFAIFSMAEEECAESFGLSRTTLLQTYHFATRQALVNASFLKTTDIRVLQSLVLFLLPCRYIYDPHTYWILTGVAFRIGQRMGLHKDGEKLGLPPFDVQMRRRLFFQLIPLEGISSQMSGVDIPFISATWDTQSPLNLNDDQIWPDMIEVPKDRQGATEMIFCLTRSCVGKASIRAWKAIRDANYGEAESVIKQAESEVEENYIRYCDIVHPLHLLAISLARSAITAMQLRIGLSKARHQNVTDVERREMFRLSQKIMDTDIAASANTSLRRYQWLVRSFFVWGSWESLVFVLTSLRSSDFLFPAEIDAAWGKIEQIHHNHPELLESKQALHTALGRATLKAWDAYPFRSIRLEPAFITTLRSLTASRGKSRTGSQEGKANSTTKSDEMPPVDPFPANDANRNLSFDTDVLLDNDFDIDNVDWTFWDQLIQAHQTQNG